MTKNAYDTKQIPFPIQDRINNRVDTLIRSSCFGH